MRKVGTIGIVCLLITVIILGILGQPENVQAQDSSDIVAYWHFDEGTGNSVADSSGNSNDGTIYGASWVDGYSGYGLSFDGTGDYVEVLNTDILNSVNEVTIMAWVNISSTSPIKFFVMTNGFGLAQTDSHIAFAISVPSTNNAQANMSFNKWEHITGTYDGTNINCYLNGNLMDTTNWPGTMSSGSRNFTFGKFNLNYWEGMIDEVYVYNRALSSDEVYAQFNNLPSPPSNLQATSGNGEVILDWESPKLTGGHAITNYNIYRGATSSSFSFLTSIGNFTSFIDTTVINDQMYYYRVTATNSVGEGNVSNTVSVTPTSGISLPSAPQDLQAIANDTKITLTWSTPSSDGGSAITNYNIYRGATSGTETLLATIGNVLTYADTSVTNNQTYFYKVTAVNSVGEGAYSNEVHATPTATDDGDGNGDDGSSSLLLPIVAIIIIIAVIIGGVAFALLRKPKTPLPPQHHQQPPPPPES